MGIVFLKTRSHWIPILLSALAACYIGMSLHLWQAMHVVAWGDTGDYIALSQGSALNKAFWTYLRPPMLALLFKLTDRNYERTAVMQIGLWLAAWLLLASAAVFLIRHKAIKPVGFGLVLLLSLSSPIFYWQKIMLTESLSNSLLVLNTAGWLLAIGWLRRRPDLHVRWQLLLALALLGMGAAWSFTRDSNAYLLLGVAAGCLLGLLFRRQQSIFLAIVLVGALVIVYLQNASADAGGRWRGPLGNTFLLRVLPYPDRTDYFIERGLPMSDDLRRYATDPENNFPPTDYILWLYDAKAIYLRYLLSDPLAHMAEPIRDWGRILDGNVLHYAHLEHPAHIQRWIDAALYSPSGFWLLAVGVISLSLALVLLLEKRADARWIAPLVLLGMVYPLAFITWHGDAQEIERHAITLSLQARLGLWLLLLFCLDGLAGWLEHAAQPRPRRLAVGLASVTLVLVILQGLFHQNRVQAAVLLPLQARLLPQENVLRYWGVSDVLYQAYQHELDEFADKDQLVIYPEVSSVNLINLADWSLTAETDITDTTSRLLLRQWRETALPSFLKQLNVGYLYVGQTWWQGRTPNQLGALENPASYRLLHEWTDSFGRFMRLYQIVGANAAAENAAGLSDEQAMLYQAHRAAFTLVPADAVVFNPTTSLLDWFNSTAELGSYIESGTWTAEQQTALFDLLVIWEHTRHEADLTLTADQAAALAQWRATKESRYLLQAGISYLLVSDLWQSYLTPEEYQQLNFSEMYALLDEWDAEIPGGYRLYQALP